MANSQVRRVGESGDSDAALTDALVDEMLAYYIDWRQDARAAAEAYGAWSCASSEDEERRFCAYMAALDQEESSASIYAAVVKEVQCALAA